MLEVKRNFCNSLQIRFKCRTELGKIPVVGRARLKPSFRLRTESRVMYLNGIQITVSKQTQNLEYGLSNLTVYYQNIRGILNKIPVHDQHSVHINAVSYEMTRNITTQS
jgi:hypothetical protein